MLLYCFSGLLSLGVLMIWDFSDARRDFYWRMGKQCHLAVEELVQKPRVFGNSSHLDGELPMSFHQI